MEWTILKNKKLILVEDREFSLKHLEDMVLNLEVESGPKHSALAFKLMVQFSSHCVSIGPKKDTPFLFHPDNICKKIVDERGIERKFCENRYQWSLKLPTVFQTILQRQCFFTGRDNWMTIEVINEDNQCVNYEVFFRVYRESGKYLRLFVESAYVRDAMAQAQNLKHFKKSNKIKGKTLFDSVASS